MKNVWNKIFGNGAPVSNYFPYDQTDSTMLTVPKGTNNNWAWTSSEDQETPYDIKITIYHDELLSLDFYVEKGLDGFVFLDYQHITVVLKDQQKTEFANNPGLFLMKIFKVKNMDPYVRQEKSEPLYQGYGIRDFIQKHKTKL
jgi:hypothetical protein